MIAMPKTKAAPTPPANAFIGKPKAPTDKELSAALGPAKQLWDRLLSELADESDVSGHEWNSYSAKAGWSLRVQRGDRIIVYLSPLAGSFRASFALGDKALKEALASDLPAPVTKLIKNAKKYAEGTAVRIEVTAPEDLLTVKKLAQAKLKH